MMIGNRGVLCIVALLSLISETWSADTTDFYQGKTVTIVVGSTVGGGFDAVARLVTRHIGNHIAGKPRIIVQNMPGAGSLMAVRYLDAVAPKDGTVMAIFNPGLIIQSIVEPERIKIDFTKFGWVGVVNPEFLVCYGYGANGIRSWNDMMSRKEFTLGASGLGTGNYLTAAMLRKIFDAPVRVILGFPGEAERRLAIARGELDGECTSIISVPVQWLQSGEAHIFVRFSEQRVPGVPESAPYIGTFAKSHEQKQLLDLLIAGDRVGRPFIMPGEVPLDRLDQMRKAFDATMNDAGFRSEMEKLQVPVGPMTGAAAQAFVAQLSATPRNLVALARQIYK
jgi:tripartite-type tricarboxylate transporter receptor subunit TctC